MSKLFLTLFWGGGKSPKSCPPTLGWGIPLLPANVVISAESVLGVAGWKAFSSYGEREVTSLTSEVSWI